MRRRVTDDVLFDHEVTMAMLQAEIAAMRELVELTARLDDLQAGRGGGDNSRDGGDNRLRVIRGGAA